MEETEEDYVYVFLEFNEKIMPTIFETELFLRVANLHQSHPLVQINNLVFKGTYDECVGTNLFFEEIEDPPVKKNIYEKETAIRLKHVLKQTKLLRLKQMKLPKKVLPAKQDNESLHINLNQSYGAVLEKLEQGILNIEDLMEKDSNLTTVVNEKLRVDVQEEISVEPQLEVETNLNLVKSNKTPTALLEAKYERLKRLARRPVKRIRSPELVADCEAKYEDAYEYHNLERQVLQSSDAFRSVCRPVVENSFAGGVDIDRCVLQSLIAPSNDLNRVLTKAELDKVLAINNLENLSIPVRYLVFKNNLTKIQELLSKSSSEELEKMEDIDGSVRTVEELCDIFKRLVDALKRHMSQVYEPANNSDSKTKSLKQDRGDEEYVKYKYVPSEDLNVYFDIYNEEPSFVANQPRLSRNSNSKIPAGHDEVPRSNSSSDLDIDTDEDEDFEPDSKV